MKSMSAGFTLVEMLVALLTFSLLAAAATALIGASLRNQDTLAAASRDIQDLQLARSIMKADFAQIALRSVRDAYGGRGQFSFVGGKPAAQGPLLAFVRGGWVNPMGAEARSSLQYVEYEVEKDTLVRRVRARLDSTSDTPVQSIELLKGVETLSVSFLSGGVWSDQWRSRREGNTLMPDAVAVEAEVAGLGRVRQVFLASGR